MVLLDSIAAWIGHGALAPAAGGLMPLTVAALICSVVQVSVAGDEKRADAESARTRDIAPAVRNRRAVVIGSGRVAISLAEKLEEEGGYRVLGLIDDITGDETESRFEMLGCRNEAAGVIKRLDVGHVFVAYAPSWQQQLTEHLATVHPEISVGIIPTAYEAMLKPRSVESFGDIAVIRVSSSVGWLSEAAKRAFDIAAASIGLLIMFPAMLAAGLLIKLTSPGPILFRQVRVGRYGKEFGLYKLRTMRIDAESNTGPVLSSGRSDSRLTKIGYWLRLIRFDELPQLWNVLQGEMSLVGPRPERPIFVQKYIQTAPSYMRRHDVRPGIAGLAQLHGGYHTDARDKLRFDLIYVANRSFALDISILARTILVVLKPQRKKFEAQIEPKRPY